MPEKSQFSREYGIFLQHLKEMREMAGFTQEQLAVELRQTQSTVSKMERGERRIDAVELYRICEILGSTSSTFMHKLEKELGSPDSKT